MFSPANSEKTVMLLRQKPPQWRHLWTFIASVYDPEHVGTILNQILEMLRSSLNARGVLLIAPPLPYREDYHIYMTGSLRSPPNPRELFHLLSDKLTKKNPPNIPVWKPLPTAVRSLFQTREALLVPVVAPNTPRAILVIVGDKQILTTSASQGHVELYAHIIAHVFSDVQIAYDLHTLLAATRDMAESQDLDTMLHRLLHYAITLTHTEAASILLQDQRTGKLVFKAAIGPQSVPLQEVKVPMNSIAGRALREERPFVVNNVARVSGHFRKVDEITGFHTRSLMAVPIHWQGNTIGVLEVVNRREGAFDEHDLSLLQALAAQAGALIRHAQLLAEREKALQELQQLDARKTQFMHLASHELRTPLTIIRGYAELVENIVQSAAQSKAPLSPEELLPLISEIIAGTQRMGVILDEITHAATFTRDVEKKDVQPVHIRAILEDIFRETQSWRQAKNLHVHVQYPSQSSPILGDYQLLREAFFQVISNAYKFTPEGGQIDVRVEENGENVYVRVSDPGPGIPEEEQERIFAPFYQIENPLTRQHPGLGLGLTIAKRAVEEHGGHIWVESRPGGGATFVISLPKGE